MASAKAVVLNKKDIFISNLDYLRRTEASIAANAEFDAFSDVASVVEVARRVVNSDSIIFDENKDWSSFAKSVVSALRTDFARIDKLFPFSVFNPYFDIFKSQAFSFVSDFLEECKLLGPVGRAEKKYSTTRLNEFVEALRQESRQDFFVKAALSYARNSSKNQASLNRYINGLFNYRSRLLVVRVDLEYCREYSLERKENITYEETDAHRKALLWDLKKHLFKDSILGYAWKLEYGLMNSFHYHFLLFFDAAKVRRDVSIARVIGEHWKNKITEGKGRYWNCNANKSQYRCCALGEVSHSDASKRKCLLMAASYLVKADYFVRSAMPPNRRSFGKGVLPKNTSRRGRPRQI